METTSAFFTPNILGRYPSHVADESDSRRERSSSGVQSFTSDPPAADGKTVRPEAARHECANWHILSPGLSENAPLAHSAHFLWFISVSPVLPPKT
jgi:hypothetical protein